MSRMDGVGIKIRSGRVVKFLPLYGRITYPCGPSRVPEEISMHDEFKTLKRKGCLNGIQIDEKLDFCGMKEAKVLETLKSCRIQQSFQLLP